MKFEAVTAQLDFLAWRDEQLSAISSQLETAFPVLLAELTAQIESAGRWNLVTTTVRLRAAATAAIERWTKTQFEAALSRAKSELDLAILQMPGGLDLDSGVWEQVSKALPALAGVGLIGASLAAIPTVVSFATVTTSFLAIWGTASISWPLFAVGTVGVSVLALTGSKSVKFAEDKARRSLCNRVHQEAARQVFGIGQKLGTRSILSDIQAAVIQAGQNRIEGERN